MINHASTVDKKKAAAASTGLDIFGCPSGPWSQSDIRAVTAAIDVVCGVAQKAANSVDTIERHTPPKRQDGALGFASARVWEP